MKPSTSRVEAAPARKDGLRTIARLLEEQMDEAGLSEEEENRKVDGLGEHVRKAVDHKFAQTLRRGAR
jgi:hypothetical protein